jgi:hypothetical protein
MAEPGIRLTASLAERVLPHCRFPVRSLLLIGSMAEGLSNDTSDIDLLAIAESTGPRSRVIEDGFEIDGRPASVLYASEGVLRRRLRQLDRLYIEGGHLTDGLVTRLANAKVIYDPSGIGERIVSAARGFVPKDDTLREMMRIALGFLNDAVGSRASGDLATAAIMARAGAAVAVDCCLLRRGERNLKPKWHARRLARLGQDSVLRSYLSVLGLENISDAEADRMIQRTGELFCEVLDVPSLDRFQEAPLFTNPTETGA